MRVTYYDKDGKVTETKDFGDKASDVVLNYDDNKLFFQIPESIIKSARSKKDKLERLYLLEQLRFLIEYDYELYTKSELCDKQDVEMSCYLRDIGCKDIEGMKPTQNDKNINYQPNPVFSEMRDRLFRHVRQKHGTNLSDIRHHLISKTKRNNIQYSRIVRDPLSKDSCYNQVYLYSDELTPEVCLLLSLLAPLGDISEKQIYEESLFKDNKFLLSIARALYRTNGINRSVLYNLLRLFMPTTYKTTQLQGVLGFSAITDISMNQDVYVIKYKDGLNNTLSEIKMYRTDLAKMFAVSDSSNVLDNIQGILKTQYGVFLENSKEQVENELCQDVYSEYNHLDSESWNSYLGYKYKELKSECKQHCIENDLYATPYFLYSIVLKYDNPKLKVEISTGLTKDVIFACAYSKDSNVIPLYHVIYSLNYIKEKAGVIKNDDDTFKSEAINNAIKYIDPIINETFLNRNTTNPKDFKELFKRILSTEPMNELIKDSTFKMPFNLKMVLNIIGLLRAKGYFAKASKPIDDELGEKNKGIFEEKAAQRRVYIDNYATKYDKKAYIQEKRLIGDIENIIKNYELQRK